MKISYGDKYKGDLEKTLLDVYFKPTLNCVKELEILKSFSIRLAINSSKDLKIDDKT